MYQGFHINRAPRPRGRADPTGAGNRCRPRQTLRSAIAGRRARGSLGIPRWTMRDAVFRGLLRWEGAMLAFRHALAQAAIANAVPGDRLQVLHRAIFAELERNSIVGPRPREVRGSENYP